MTCQDKDAQAVAKRLAETEAHNRFVREFDEAQFRLLTTLEEIRGGDSEC